MVDMIEYEELHAGPDDAGRRLDRILKAVLRDEGLSSIYSALRKGRVLVNGKKAEAADRLREGDLIEVDRTLMARARMPSGRPLSSGLDEIGIYLIAATRDLLFLNKPWGILVHGSGGLDTLVRRALASRSASSISFEPGPLNRLDRNTTGIVVFPRSAEGSRRFASLLRSRRLAKGYVALLLGELREGGLWSDRISRDGDRRTSSIVLARVGDDGGDAGGAVAEATAYPLLSRSGYSLAGIVLHTGRTHQIRVQSSGRGHPLAGDGKYGGGSFPGGYILHASFIAFEAPLPFDDLPSRVVAPLPEGARSRLEAIFGADALASAIDSFVGLGFSS
jgi:23S rRNA pseudouridine955/2504/2580 synthase